MAEWFFYQELTCSSGTHSHTNGTAMGSNLGFSISPKDTSTCIAEEPGIDPPTFWFLDDPLCLLSHSHIESKLYHSLKVCLLHASIPINPHSFSKQQVTVATITWLILSPEGWRPVGVIMSRMWQSRNINCSFNCVISISRPCDHKQQFHIELFVNAKQDYDEVLLHDTVW